jgi:hypothetical protein
MEKKGIFLVKDFEAQLWDVIETENQVAGFPTNGYRYPNLDVEIGNIEVRLHWRVENWDEVQEINSVYSCITYSAGIKGVNGAFDGELTAKRETYFK